MKISKMVFTSENGETIEVCFRVQGVPERLKPVAEKQTLFFEKSLSQQDELNREVNQELDKIMQDIY